METKEILEKELALITIDKEWLNNPQYGHEIFKIVQDYRMQVLDKLIDLERELAQSKTKTSDY